MPLPVFAPSSPAAAAFEELWTEVAGILKLARPIASG
jgi:hypothetical protein